MMKTKLFLLMTGLVLLSCSEQKQGTEGNQYYPDEVDEDTTYVTLEEAGGDSLLVGSSTYSQTERELGMLLYEVESVQSTSMLQMLLEHYDADFQKAVKDVENAVQSGLCSDEEIATLQSQLSSIQSTVNSAMNKYTVPAAGVLGTLNMLTRNIGNARTKEELDKALSSRGAVVNTLSTLHLVVQEPSQQREVHRQAKELQRLIERKKAELQ